MEKVVSKKVHFCDNCGKEQDYITKCMGCSVEYCYDCEKKLMIKYSHVVNFSGSGDGYFCKKCDTNPPEKMKKLHNVYQVIRALKLEATEFYNNFDKRSKVAEE